MAIAASTGRVARLEQITLRRFKSYYEATLYLAPLTLLVGANASGKSNAIEVIRILSWLARGQRLDAITSSIQSSDTHIRGQVQDLVFEGAHSFEIGCMLSDMEGWDRLHLEIGIGKGALHIVNETIERSDGRLPLYRLDHDLRVEYNHFTQRGKRPQVTCSDQIAAFIQLESPARFKAGHKKAQETIPRIVRGYRERLASILFLDPRPSAMRGYSFKTETRIKDDGANLSAVAYNLCQDAATKDRLIGFVANLPEQDIKDIGFIETPRGEVMLQMVERFGGRDRKVDAPLLSDGTLQVLSIAAALLSAPKGALVVIENIDNSVYPSRAKALLQHIQKIATERGLSVLSTCHNPALLDALPVEAIPKVAFCYRDPKRGDSRLVRLQDLSHAPELMAQGHLGRLVTEGLLERFVKFRPRGKGQHAGGARFWPGA